MQQWQYHKDVLKLISDLQTKVHKLYMVNLELIKALRDNDLLSHQERMHLLDMQALNTERNSNGKSKTT